MRGDLIRPARAKKHMEVQANLAGEGKLARGAPQRPPRKGSSRTDPWKGRDELDLVVHQRIHKLRGSGNPAATAGRAWKEEVKWSSKSSQGWNTSREWAPAWNQGS